MARRPEHEAPPDIYYNDDTAAKYHVNSRVQEIQRRMTERAIELLQLPAGVPCHLLDLGCGSGLSGHVLAGMGHTWVGMDFSRSMLRICKEQEFESSDEDDAEEGEEVDDDENANADADDNDDDDGAGDEEEGGGAPEGERQRRKWAEVMQADMGEGVPFRPGVFDGVVSISAVQWLCNIDKKGQVPQKRLRVLFQTLYNCMRRGSRAVLQFYPESATQMNMISQAAMKCGFGGGMVVDFPHSTRAKKYFLVIYAGTTGSGGYAPPQPLLGNPDEDDDEMYSDDGDDLEEGEEYDEDDDDEDDGGDHDPRRVAAAAANKHRVRVDGRNRRNKHAAAAEARKRRRKDNRPMAGTKEWVLLKKSQRRNFGLDTHVDSKYTMRRRKPRF